MAGNTAATIYIDSQGAKGKCDDERKAINRHCKPEPPQSEKDEKKKKPRKRKGGLTGKLGEVGEKLDSYGKTLAAYKRDRSSLTATDGNGWMEDHCTGLWITPSDVSDPELMSGLEDLMKKLKDDNLSLMLHAFNVLVDIAIETAGKAAVKKALGFAARTVGKTVIGAVGIETGIVPAAMAAWTVADLASTAVELAKLAGPQGQAAYDALMELKNIEEKADKILKDYKDHPHKAHADAMTLMALVDPCTRARKCMLVPYKNTTGGKWKINELGEEAEDDGEDGVVMYVKKATAQANHGHGCCPGQTGHHVLPHSMVKSADCPGYSRKEAPTICLEGRKNGFEHGSHGAAHKNLSESMEDYRKKNGNTDTISYDIAKELGVDAVQKAGAFHCSEACLKAQLDEHYKCAGKDLKAVAGTGGGATPAPPPIQNEGV